MIHDDRQRFSDSADRQHRILLKLTELQRDTTNLAYQLAAALEVSMDEFAHLPSMGRVLIGLLEASEEFKRAARFSTVEQ